MVASGTRGIAPYFFRIAWTVSNADSCAREGAWSTADEEGMPPIGEVQEMTLQDGWYTFTIRCRNAEGEASASTTIIVTQPMAP
jgi:hypothetical protein